MKSPLRLLHVLVLALSPLLFAQSHGATPDAARSVTSLAGPGWKLWRDAGAKWKDDVLFAPPVDLATVPVNPPTGGWEQLDSPATIPCSVPDTAEGILGDGSGPKTAVLGVTWWTTTLKLPAFAAGRRVLLQFDSTRQRAEVYLDRKLVGYDLVGSTPFSLDLTGALKPGSSAQLAVRITHPGGNYAWNDSRPLQWGRYSIPMSHGFAGITGDVRLVVCDEAYVDDLYVQNTPAPGVANALLTLRNTTSGPVTRDIIVSVVSRGAPSVEVFRHELKAVTLPTGDSPLSVKISVPAAKIWDLASPSLYECRVQVRDSGRVTDDTARTFGFRWFDLVGIGDNARLHLNGRRIMLRTAISWGHWPVNGFFPSRELAEKQVRAAKAFGLNMLNFHRTLGDPVALTATDELGLLMFEEPGGYVSPGTDPFAQALAREKLLRMVKRDRSHPSLIIYNMINEQWSQFGADKDPALFAVHRADLEAAHAADPSRLLLYTSAWAGRSPDPEKDPAKMHMRPFDDRVYLSGWFDVHRAGGPMVWQQSDYRDPTHHYGNTENRREITYDGEEGAVSSPPRLGLIKAALAASPRPGWDGAVYAEWIKGFEEFLDTKHLRASFPTIDDLCTAMGAVSLGHQGRKIEDTRICDAKDGYAINGWEATLIDNHSGVVDSYRNPKADPALLAHYAQPLYVAVKTRRQIVQVPDKVTVDFFTLNELGRQGPHMLKIRALDPSGKSVFTREVAVTLQGGEVFSQLAAEAVDIPIAGQPGSYRIEAALVSADGREQASGHEQVLAVDWKSARFSSHGAVEARDDSVARFLQTQFNVNAPRLDAGTPKLDWLVINRSAQPEPVVVPAARLRYPVANQAGLRATFHPGRDFSTTLHERTDQTVDVRWSEGAPPDPAVPLIGDYSVRWDGELQPTASGAHTFNLIWQGAARLWIDGKLVVDKWDAPPRKQNAKVKMDLTAGHAVTLKLEYYRPDGNGEVHLLWQSPDAAAADTDPSEIFRRAREDGTTVLILARPETWIDAINKETTAKITNPFKVGGNWLGGQFFVKDHPLFKGLPVNQALDWPYQSVLNNGRQGFDMQGEETVCGAYQTWPFRLGTSVAVIPCGKGKIVVSTLDICDRLLDPDNTAETARKLFCNALEFASP